MSKKTFEDTLNQDYHADVIVIIKSYYKNKKCETRKEIVPLLRAGDQVTVNVNGIKVV